MSAPSSASGEIPRITLRRLADTFVADEEVMAGLLERLRRDRVLVLSGARFTGRHTAALMLLHRLGADPVRTLVRDTGPATLADRFTSENQARGYLLSDLATRRDSPLREPHVLAAKDRLVEQDAYLVVTVGPTTVLDDVPRAEWRPPRA